MINMNLNLPNINRTSETPKTYQNKIKTKSKRKHKTKQNKKQKKKWFKHMQS